ncbi:hypothetical protein GGR57DRAFT_95835 [Xylariaceae sp. FL1272]|nr:hypothetical protein GGR57DRAFT_95835 [Xylariaceae sp. FL1272]
MASNLHQPHADASGYRSTFVKIDAVLTFCRGLKRKFQSEKEPKPEPYQRQEPEMAPRQKYKREFKEPQSMEEVRFFTPTGQLNDHPSKFFHELPAEPAERSSRNSRVYQRNPGKFHEDFEHPDIILPPHPAFAMGPGTQSANSSIEATLPPSSAQSARTSREKMSSTLAPTAATSFASARSMLSRSSRATISGTSVRPVKPPRTPEQPRTWPLAGESVPIPASAPAATAPTAPALPQPSSPPPLTHEPGRGRIRDRNRNRSASFAALRQLSRGLRNLRSPSRPCKPPAEAPRLELQLPTDLTAQSLFADLGYETPASDDEEEEEGEAVRIQQETAIKYCNLRGSDVWRGDGRCKDPRLVRIPSGRWFGSRV